MGRALSGPIASRLSATEHGEGASWLVLSHGFGTTQAVWEPVIRRFQDTHRILTYDLAYVGQGEREEPFYADLAAYADDLIGLLIEHEIAGATIIGHSASGMIGLLAAVTEPALVRHRILLNASPRYLDDTDYIGGASEADFEAIAHAIRSNYGRWVLDFAPAVTAAQDGEGLSVFVQGLLSLRPDLALTVLKTIYAADVRALVSEAPCSITLIQSRKDIAVPPEVGAYMVERAPGAQLIELDVEGHLPHLTAPDVVLPALEDALQQGAAWRD